MIASTSRQQIPVITKKFPKECVSNIRQHSPSAETRQKIYVLSLVLKGQTSLNPDPGFWQTFCRTTTSMDEESIDYSAIHLIVDSIVRFDVSPAKSAHYISMAHRPCGAWAVPWQKHAIFDVKCIWECMFWPVQNAIFCLKHGNYC